MTPQKSSSIRIYSKSSSSKKEKDQSQQSDFDREGVKKDFELIDSNEQNPEKKVAKTKRIKKEMSQPRIHYLNFYNFYYAKMSK